MTSVHASTHSADAAGNGPLTSPASNPSPVYSSIAVDDVELDHVHGETKTQPQKGIRPCRNAINQGWARRLLFHPGTSLGLIFFGVLGLFCLRNRTQNLFTNEGSACRSDGFFSLSFGTSTTWMSDSAFSIDINFGNLSFAQAKLVDIWWNVGIGRGAQVILAIFTHSIFSRSLTCIMETSSVPYDTFKATTLQDNTFHGLLSLSLSLSRNKSHRTRGTMVWMVIASFFVLLAPTWLSATTGYVTAVNSFVADKDGILLPINRFQPAIYTIHNGAVLKNGQDEMMIAVPWSLSGDDNTIEEALDTRNIYGCGGVLVKVENDTLSLSQGHSTDIQCLWLWSVSYYVSQYGFLGLSPSSNTTFYQPNISDTLLADSVSLIIPLNISAHLAYSDAIECLNLNQLLPQPYGRNNPVFWDAVSGTMYSLAELNENGPCMPSIGQVRYQWGFSHNLLYIFVSLLFVWVFGMWILHSAFLCQSRLVDHKMGYEHAIMDISQSFPGAVHEAGNAGLQSNKELQTSLRQSFLTCTTLPFDATTTHTFNLPQAGV